MLREILLAGTIAVSACATVDRVLPPRRTINVCVAYDSYEPQKEAIREAFRYTNTAFEREVNLSHKIIDEVEYDSPPGYLETFEQVMELCPDNTEIYFLTTNDALASSKEGHMYVETNQHGQYSYWRGKHFVELFQVRRQMNNELYMGITALDMSVLHEFGHVWGADHVDDDDSFMHYALASSKAEWDNQSRNTIMEHRNMRFSVD